LLAAVQSGLFVFAFLGGVFRPIAGRGYRQLGVFKFVEIGNIKRERRTDFHKNGLCENKKVREIARF